MPIKIKSQLNYKMLEWLKMYGKFTKPKTFNGVT